MEHYYSEKQKSEFKIKKIRQIIIGLEFEFFTSPGVFSKDKVDMGTLVLAENMIVKNNQKILDIGCGIGILGIAAAKLYGSKIVMSDINERAITLAKKNLGLNNVEGEVFQGNLYERIQDNDFDLILSNPPQNAGKKLCFEIIEKSINYLKPGGSLQLVARHNKGGRTLSNKMKEVFGNLQVITKKSGYWVYISIKTDY